MPDLLIEIGCEEIPARMIPAASAELQTKILRLLEKHGLSPEGTLGSNATPRRLTVIVDGLPAKQQDTEEQLIGPATKIAFKDGEPTPAAYSFAKRVGVDVAALLKIETPKGTYLAAKVAQKGRSASEVLIQALPTEIASLSWVKSMYWRRGKPERFVRPVRWIVCLLDQELLPIEFAGVTASNESRGHRVLGPERVVVSAPKLYNKTLESAHVVASAGKREQIILRLLSKAISELPGARWREDAELLNTVVNLTEFPGVVLGNFDPSFLSLPEEVLVTVMRDHQKYFAVEDASGKLAPHFLAVLNTDGDHDGTIRHGNERVLRARFNDAQFFWQTDQKIPLTERIEMLRNVTFQKDLGSYWTKTERMRGIAGALIEELTKKGIAVSGGIVDRAALLAKTDLTTELVKEFTELQGIVGGLYAKAQGDAQAVADAIYDHYRPESTDDPVPRSNEGAIVSLADKADSIAGMFSLGLQPSGSKDPFALRRQANGIVRILAEHRLPLHITEIFDRALEQYRGSGELKAKLRELEKAPQLLAGFFRERLEFYLRDVRGFAYDVVNAVLGAGADDVVDAIARAEAVTIVRPTENFVAISAAFKRIKNILRQAAEAGKRWPEEFNGASLVEIAEQALASRVAEARTKVAALSKEKNYEQTLAEIAQLRPVVDTFFDKVMVMVEDEKLRANRLALLATMQRSFSTVADFSEIVTDKVGSAS